MISRRWKLILHIESSNELHAVANNGRPIRPNPIVCQFTRRLTRDTVLSSRSNSSQLTAEALGLPPILPWLIVFWSFHTLRLDCKFFSGRRRNIRMRTITNGAGLKIPEFSLARQTHHEWCVWNQLMICMGSLRMRESSQLRSDWVHLVSYVVINILNMLFLLLVWNVGKNRL